MAAHKIKYLVLSFLFLFSLVNYSSAWLSTVVSGGSTPPAAGPAPDYYEDFNYSNNADVGGTCTLLFDDSSDATYDPNGYIDIYNNQLRVYCSTASGQGYAFENDGIGQLSELTLFFKVSFGTVEGVDDANGSYAPFNFRISTTNIGTFRFVASSGDLYGYQVRKAIAGSALSSSIQMTSVATSTDYYCYFYYKYGAASTGVFEGRCDSDVNISDSSWAAASLTGQDVTGGNYVDRIDAGQFWNDWNNGGVYVYFDNAYLYSGDQRSCTNCIE